ncbi:hypothetical protein AB0912_07525 [Streptomyces sp. NPDC007084]|uniref:hypothetical protein n=1 Tax=Streptomyces sp. NPDC007084 TaxID=3154313 RepID=UPI003454AACE
MSTEREPSATERAAWERVRAAATGMNHHQAKAAFEDAERAAAQRADDGPDPAAIRAELEEWERITGTLADHAGSYDPATDPFVQGQLTARANRARASVRRR